MEEGRLVGHLICFQTGDVRDFVDLPPQEMVGKNLCPLYLLPLIDD